MEKKYYAFNTGGKLFIFIILIVTSFAIPGIIRDVQGFRLFTVLIGFPILLICFILSFFMKIEITENSIMQKIAKYTNRNYTVANFADVESIRDEYCLFFHVFFIVEKKKSEIKYRRQVFFTNLFTQNHKEILNEIILRVPKNTQIDDSILKRIKLSRDEIGSLQKF